LTAVIILTVILEGAVRKWILPGQQIAVYFVKDALIIGLFLSQWFGRERKYVHFVLATIQEFAWARVFGLYALVVLIEIFNPALPSIAVGLFGAKAHLLYFLAALCFSAAYLAKPARMMRDIRLLVVLALLVDVLCAVQFSLPAGHFLNTYLGATSEDEIVELAFGRVRVTGTFSYITGMTIFGTFSGLLALGFTLASKVTRKWKMLYYACAAGNFVAVVMSGSRYGVLAYLVGAVMVILMCVSKQRKRVSVTLSAVLLLIFSSIVLSFFSYATEAFLDRVQTASVSDDAQSRVTSWFFNFIYYVGFGGTSGYGTGATHPAVAALVPGEIPYSWLYPVNWLHFEDEFSRIAIELGWVGLLLYFSFRVLLGMSMFRTNRDSTSELTAILGSVCCSVYAVSFGSSFIFDVTANFFVWYFVGLSLSAVMINRSYSARSRMAAARPSSVTQLGAAIRR